MINGLLSKIKDYKGLNEGLDIAIDYILNTNLNDLPLGLTVIDEKRDITVNKLNYLAKKEPSGLCELHRHHLDMQILLKGTEICYFGYYHKNLEDIKAYDYKEDKDIIQYKIVPENKLVFDTTNFTLFTNTDIHSPGNYVNDEDIIKLVFKIKI